MTVVKCPNCHSFDVTRNSPRVNAMRVALVLIVFGVVLSFILVGIPLLIIGVILFCVTPYFKEDGKLQCKNCKNNFIPNENS